MAHITEEHLHHLARRHHQTMKKLEASREKWAGFAQKSVGTLETLAGAWAGGIVEGKTGGGTLLKLPINFLAGAVLLAVGHLPLVGPQWSGHANNLGNGFLASYLAATGYAFGKRWKETKKLFGGGGHPWLSPYENGWAHAAAMGPPAVHGDLSEAQMASIVQRMQAAAAMP